jgi:hypothetical protein
MYAFPRVVSHSSAVGRCDSIPKLRPKFGASDEENRPQGSQVRSAVGCVRSAAEVLPEPASMHNCIRASHSDHPAIMPANMTRYPFTTLSGVGGTMVRLSGVYAYLAAPAAQRMLMSMGLKMTPAPCNTVTRKRASIARSCSMSNGTSPKIGARAPPWQTSDRSWRGRTGSPLAGLRSEPRFSRTPRVFGCSMCLHT